MIQLLITLFLVALSSYLYGYIRNNLTYKSYLCIYNHHRKERYRIQSDSFSVLLGTERFVFQKLDSRWFYKSGESDFNAIDLNNKININQKVICIEDNYKLAQFFDKYYYLVCSVVVLLPVLYISKVFIMDTPNVYEEYDHESIVEDETPKEVPNEISEDNNINQVTENVSPIENNIISIVQVKGMETQTVTNIMDYRFSDNTIFVDDQNIEYYPNELVGRKLCLYYNGAEGNTCFFVGQFNEKLHWDGNCSICSYKEGKLFFTTDDLYYDDKLVHYNRISIYNGKWLYTNKDVSHGIGISGDTYSYNFVEIKAKEYDISSPKEEYLYSVDDVREILKDELTSHYYGEYDEGQAWNDSDGGAYRILYDNGKITEIFTGTFINSSYRAGEFARVNEDGKIYYEVGIFKDEFGNKVQDQTSSRLMDYDEYKVLMRNQPFYDEAVLGLSYLE